MMKIPETSANVGAYYGNEENGQWQVGPNGVIIDNGVGGGVVGSGDAGMHRAPVYPVHIPRGHMPVMSTAGYVMAAGYYGGPYAAVPQPDDFSDYMWMENEEEFDKQVLQQLEEEALMEQCIEAMLEDEQRERRAHRGNRQDLPTTSNGVPSVSLEEAVSRSTLNPLAAEFVPTRVRLPPTPTATEDKQVSPPSPQAEAPSPSATETDSAGERDGGTEAADEAKTEEAATPPKDPPEVSAADIYPTSKLPKKDKDAKKPDPKKVLKPELKKKAPVVVKSDTKVQPKKKELKPVRSDVRVEDKSEETPIPAPLVELPTPPTPTTEEPTTAGPKPINYAAAARASKPKPKSTTPPAEKPTPQPVKEKPTPPPSREKPTEVLKDKVKTNEKVERKSLSKEKTLPKEKVNGGQQRKNSAK